MFSTKTIYNLAYWSLSALCLALLFVLLHYEVIPRSLYSYGFALIMVTWPVIERIAAKLCEKLGVSQQSVKVERFERVDNSSPELVANTLEYPEVSKLQTKLVLLAIGLFCVAFGILFWLLNPSEYQNMVGIISLPLYLFIFGVLTALLLIRSRANRSLADEQGIYVQPSLFSQKKLVPWREIQQMEIETKRNVLGDVDSITFSLQDAAGQEQKMLFLQALPEATREELVYMTTTNANLQQCASLSNTQSRI